jgi:hypothetical protein
MAITYRIDRERGRVHTTCAGNVTLPEVRAHFDALQRDPDRPRSLSVLLDFSGMTSLPAEPQLQAAAQHVGQVEEIVFEACAIVADRDEVAAMARAFETLARGHFAALKIFRQRRQAEEWLDSF